MEIILRGVRGSIPNPAPETAFYGGNTTCIEVRTDGGQIIFFDAGTGIRAAGDELPDSGECHVFLSHSHTDHTLGICFFKPIHSPNWVTNLYLPEWMESLPEDFYRCGFFPVPFDNLQGVVKRHVINEGDKITIGDGPHKAVVEAFSSCHPGGGMGYRLLADNEILVYSGDHEIENNDDAKIKARQILKDADFAVVDAMYDKTTYNPGWGHSMWEDWVEAAKDSGVHYLILSHHNPLRQDSELDKLEEILETMPQNNNLSVHMAREGMRLVSSEEKIVWRKSNWLSSFLTELSRYRNENEILDRILTKAREITTADAGTIFLAEDDELVFAYTHNDSLFSVNDAHKYIYTNLRLPINKDSIVGYAASTGRTLNLPDVRALPSGVPYKLNDEFDRKTGFKTVSVLTVPIFNSANKLLGVLQLINSLDLRSKQPVPFSALIEQNIHMLTLKAAGILERSALEKNVMHGMLRMATVHDPAETGPHAERVGAISAEIYTLWAERQGHTLDSIRYEKGRVHLASMLHDIGKVGISESILKKPGKLSDEEFAIMRGHTTLGASILADDSGDMGDIAELAHDIALHHHQKWNGKGYAACCNAGRLAGEEIPLAARITAIADVFDALVSPRCYKKPWSFEDAVALLQKESGEHFDPELVFCICEIIDTIKLIYQRFPDAQTAARKDESK
jgi:HD-GYP domain-containing protein (c-di-GMP phosphodiesterase class II)/phosphoribosyl 1,2-cyclic phosphodiesterase